MEPQGSSTQKWRADTSIGRWRLENFKSVRHANVPLSPLTILVGANSAGKSSLLHSILAVVQASGTPGNRFPLNGGTVRLGTVQQNRYAGPCEEPPAGIEVGAQFLIDGARQHARVFGLRSARRMYMGAYQATMDWHLKLGEHPVTPGGPARIESVGVEARYRPASSDSHIAETSASLRLESVLSPKAQDPESEEQSFQGTYLADADPMNVTSAVLRGGFPLEALVHGPRLPLLWTIWQNTYLSMNREGRPEGSKPAQSMQKAADLVVADIERAYNPFRADDLAGMDIERQVALELRQNADQAPSMLLDANSVLSSDLYSAVVDRLESRGYGGTTVVHNDLDTLRPSVQQTLEFLRTRVRYLGPLRDDPRVVYQDSPEAGNGYVGSKGEFSAAVLQRSGNTQVRVPMPGAKVGQTRQVTLSRAVNAWAEFLEIGSGFSTTDMGRLGLQVQVAQPDVSVALDLTSVGTGVSQVLPVLVMCLQASEGSLLMIEQPELHLNPRVQQRLADFLIAVAASGRQLLVETHSEYLISRLRLRVAQDETDTIQHNVGFLFAERAHGCTQYREVSPNAYGGLENWPEDFFDQGAEEAQEILRAAVSKRRGRIADHGESPR